MPDLRTSGIHHLALRTSRLQAVEQFYRALLGLPLVSRQHDDLGCRSIWLRLGEASVLMLERASPHEPPVPLGSLELLAFRVRAQDAHDWERRLANARVKVEGRTATTLYVRDPDGRRVGISHYPFDQ